MSDDINRQILEELRKMNEKLDRLQESRGLSTPMKLLAIFLGFLILGPIFAGVISFLFSFFEK